MPIVDASSTRDRLVASLVAERDEARERVRQLEALIAVPKDAQPITDYQSALGLTHGEARLFHLLMTKDIVLTHAQACEAMWGDEQMSDKIISVLVHKIRSKVNLFDITVEVVWGKGYKINAAMKAKTQAYMAQWRAGGGIDVRERVGNSFRFKMR